MQLVRPFYVPVTLKSMPKISVVILTKDKSEYLIQAINSLILQDYKNMEIIIGDTGSSKQEYNKIVAYLETVNKNHEIYYVNIGQYNFSRNNNDIVREYVSEDSEFILFMNNDVKLLNNVLYQMLYLYEVVPNIGTVGCQLLYLEGTIQHQGIKILKSNVAGNYAFGHKEAWTWNFKFDTPSINFGNTGACMMIRRDTFEELEMFNEDYESCMQDVQLNFDCIRNGLLNITINQALAEHDESSTRKLDKTDKEKLQRDLRYVNRYIFLNQFVEIDGKKVDILENYYEKV